MKKMNFNEKLSRMISQLQLFQEKDLDCEDIANMNIEVLNTLVEIKKEVDYDLNGIYPSQIEFANDLYDALLTNGVVIGKAPMQYGKSSTAFYLANDLLSKTLKPSENVLFMTSMGDTALFIQNKNNLETKKFITPKGERLDSKIVVTKMNPNFRDNAEQIIRDNNVKYIIFDECDYGSSNDSLFNKTFFTRLKKGHFDVKLLLLSATPYCALEAVYSNELNAKIVEARIPYNYFGVNKMLREGMVTDINNIYEDDIDEMKTTYTLISKNEDKSFNLSPEFIEDLNWFKSQTGGGLAIVRAKNSSEASLIKMLTTSHYRNLIQILSDNDDGDNGNVKKNTTFEAISIGVNSIPIKEILGESNITLKNKIIHKGDKILLIVVNALSAGKDLGELKEYVRLVVETRKGAVANGSQGLIGRVCGYHENRNIRMVGSLDVLRNYCKLENNSEVMKDPSFISETIDLKLDFSTQLIKSTRNKTKTMYEQKVNGVFKFSDVTNENKRLKNLFPDNDFSFGTWGELVKIIVHEKRTAANSHINTQRSSNYDIHDNTFKTIWSECKNRTINFGSRFHRFRAEGNDNNRLRIKRGIIINDETKEFYIVDRLSDGTKLKINGKFKNKSCYIDKKYEKV